MSNTSEIEMEEHFKVLGLPSDAGIDEIKRNFRNKARKYHPDKNPQNKEWAELKFKELKRAYEFASNHAIHREHDSRKRKQEDARSNQEWCDDPKSGNDEEARNYNVFVVHCKTDTNTAIYNAVAKIVKQTGCVVVSSCTLHGVKDVVHAVKNSRCTICLLTPSFVQDEWCNLYCSEACEVAVENRRCNVFYVKPESFDDWKIPAGLKSIEGLSFPNRYFEARLRNTLTL